MRICIHEARVGRARESCAAQERATAMASSSEAAAEADAVPAPSPPAVKYGCLVLIGAPPAVGRNERAPTRPLAVGTFLNLWSDEGGIGWCEQARAML